MRKRNREDELCAMIKGYTCAQDPGLVSWHGEKWSLKVTCCV